MRSVLLSMSSMAATVVLSNNNPAPTSLRRAAGHTDPAIMHELLQKLGPTAVEVDADVDESGRSALHHACWRGSLDNVNTLLDLGCDINAWSTGRHSYGKTPIFYAITMCRDNVVETLLERGAALRILNNKGQSVLSLAASHLSPSVLAALEEQEAREGDLPPELLRRIELLPSKERPTLVQGGWLDFWTSHPDGEEYGDLDPRFVTPSHLEELMGRGGLQTRLSINPTSREGRRLKRHLPGRNKPPPPPTPPPSRTPPAQKTSHDALIVAIDEAVAPLEALLRRHAAANGSGDEADVLDAATVSAAADALVSTLCATVKGAWLRAAALRIGRAASDVAASGLLREAASVVVGSGGEDSSVATLRKRLLLAAAEAPSEAEEASQREEAAAAQAEAQAKAQARAQAVALAEGRRVERVARLTVRAATPPESIHWVDDVAGLERLKVALVGAARVGIDTEWAEGETDSVSDAVLATIQLAVETPAGDVGADPCVFVVDALEADREYASVLDGLLRDLLLKGAVASASAAPLPVGFAFVADSTKIAKWLAKVEGGDAQEMAVTIRDATVDIQRLAEMCGLGSHKRSPSLRSTCEHWLGLLMDKEEQRSEWSSRPLQPEQLSYAALDASICLDVLEAMEVDWQGSDVDGPKLF